MILSDHLTIDEILQSVESKIDMFSAFKTSLYQILSMEDFISFRNDITKFLFELESNTTYILNAFKELQQSNRNLYDIYVGNQNDLEDAKIKLRYFNKETEFLRSKLNDATEHINFLQNSNINQEKYINELIEKLKKKETECYGAQITKFIKETEENKKKLNYNYNHLELPTQQIKTVTVDDINIIYQNQKRVSDKKNSQESFQDAEIKQDNLSPIQHPANGHTPIISVEKIAQSLQQDMEERKNLSLFEYKTGAPTEFPSIKLTEVGKREPSEKLENTNSHPDDSAIRKNKIDRVQKIVVEWFSNKEIFCRLKKKFGDDFENKIISENVSEEYLAEVEKELENISKDNKDKERDTEPHESPFPTFNQNNFCGFESKKENEEEIQQSIPEKDIDEDEGLRQTAKFNSKQMSSRMDKKKTAMSNAMKKQNESSSLKNYFILNLKRDLMLSKGNKF